MQAKCPAVDGQHKGFCCFFRFFLHNTRFICVCVCFLCFFFDFSSCLLTSFYPSLGLFVYFNFFWEAYLFTNASQKGRYVGFGSVGGEDLGEIGGGETIIRIFWMKINRVSIKMIVKCWLIPHLPNNPGIVVCAWNPSIGSQDPQIPGSHLANKSHLHKRFLTSKRHYAKNQAWQGLRNKVEYIVSWPQHTCAYRSMCINTHVSIHIETFTNINF